MTRRTLVFASAAALGAAAIAAAAWWLLSRGDGPGEAERTGSALARGVLGAVEAASEIGAPVRCARFDPGDANANLALDLATEELTIGFVGDTRGASEPTIANLRRIRTDFEKAMVDIVVTAGGMGATTDELTAALGVLATDAGWHVLAIPGDREDIEAHRAAVEALGPTVHDGSRARFVTIGPAVIGTLPGAGDASHMPSGVAGCMHTRADITDTVSSLGKSSELRRVLVSYVAPRQSGGAGSDLAAGGVHVGSIAIAEALSEADVDLVVHAMVDPPTRPEAEGTARLGDGADSVSLATGSADSVPIHSAQISGAALIVHIEANRMSWRRLLYWLDD
jgi:Icc-related predicted phosphoesterase